MSDSTFNTSENEAVLGTLNQILELELAGLVRYLHYSFMIFGHNRIPIVGWLLGQADESKAHATQAGESTRTSVGVWKSKNEIEIITSARKDAVKSSDSAASPLSGLAPPSPRPRRIIAIAAMMTARTRMPEIAIERMLGVPGVIHAESVRVASRKCSAEMK